VISEHIARIEVRALLYDNCIRILSKPKAMQDNTKQSKSNEGTTSTSACLALVVSVAIGAGLALLSAKTIFQAVPTDLSRIGVILNALDEDNQQAEFVVLGNSVAMASIDTKILRSAVKSGRQGLNLATTGQSPIESYLYYQELPESVSLIIQTINPEWFTIADDLEEQKYNTFYMFDYEPDSWTETVLVDTFGDEMEQLLAKSALQQRFESRWALRQMLDRMARSAFRPELTLDRSIYDLEHPSTGAPRLPAPALQRALKQKYASGKISKAKFRVGKRKMKFLEDIVDRAENDNRQLVLVFAPKHPEAYNFAGESYYPDARERFKRFAQDNDISLIDAMDVVPGELYSDAVHPSDEGAVIMSEYLAGELAKLYKAGTLR
jgi:hypothetical protein